jgi:hypothetical protein
MKKRKRAHQESEEGSDESRKRIARPQNKGSAKGGQYNDRYEDNENKESSEEIA